MQASESSSLFRSQEVKLRPLVRHQCVGSHALVLEHALRNVGAALQGGHSLGGNLCLRMQHTSAALQAAALREVARSELLCAPSDRDSS